MRLNKKNNKGGFTLVELVVVITILIILTFVYGLVNGKQQKAKDLGRAKIVSDFIVYYEDVKGAIGTYPSGGITNVGAATSIKALSKAVNSGPLANGYYAKFDFSGDRDSDGYYNTSPLKELQKALVAAGSIGSPSDLTTLDEGEQMIMFTSKTGKRVVGCAKVFTPTENSAGDGDGIPDDKDPAGPDGSKNGNRIQVTGDMGLWNYLNQGNNATGEATRKCQELVDPRDL